MDEEKPKNFKLQKTVSTRQHGLTALVSLILGALFSSSVIGMILIVLGIISAIIWISRTVKENKNKPHPPTRSTTNSDESNSKASEVHISNTESIEHNEKDEGIESETGDNHSDETSKKLNYKKLENLLMSTGVILLLVGSIMMIADDFISDITPSYESYDAISVLRLVFLILGPVLFFCMPVYRGIKNYLYSE